MYVTHSGWFFKGVIDYLEKQKSVCSQIYFLFLLCTFTSVEVLCIVIFLTVDTITCVCDLLRVIFQRGNWLHWKAEITLLAIFFFVGLMHICLCGHWYTCTSVRFAALIRWYCLFLLFFMVLLPFCYCFASIFLCFFFFIFFYFFFNFISSNLLALLIQHDPYPLWLSLSFFSHWFWGW